MLTKFETYRGSSEEVDKEDEEQDDADDDDIDLNAISDESSVRNKSASKQSNHSEPSERPSKFNQEVVQKDKSEDEDEVESEYESEEDEDTDTARESNGTSGRPEVITENAFNADFEDISE